MGHLTSLLRSVLGLLGCPSWYDNWLPARQVVQESERHIKAKTNTRGKCVWTLEVLSSGSMLCSASCQHP